MSPTDAQRYATSILLMLMAELVCVKGSGDRLAFVKGAGPVVDESQQIPGVIELRNKAS